VQNGLWLGEGSVNDVEGDNDASTDITPSSAAKFSGWDLPALRAEESRPVSANGADGKQKNWARVKVRLCFELHRYIQLSSHIDDVCI
jgi:hypothetical protein